MSRLVRGGCGTDISETIETIPQLAELIQRICQLSADLKCSPTVLP